MTQLETVSAMLTRLAERGVVFVHWKSNEHLAAALRGETDLDLLVDPVSRDAFVEVVGELGFVAVEPPRERKLPGLESFIGFDEATGTLVHLDVHYRIVLGEQLLKNHHLPVERWLLSDNETMEGMAIPRPEREMVILYARSGLKTKTRQIVRAGLRGGSPYPENIRREARWLAERVDPAGLGATVAGSGLEITEAEVAEFHRRALAGDFDWRYVLAQKRRVLSELRQYQRMPWHKALPRRLWLRSRNGRVMRRLGLGLPRRHLAFAAPVVAAVGADGSGKTRLTRDLEAWLGAKIVVRHVYFGQPKSGLVFRLLNKPASLTRARGGDPGTLVRYIEAAKWLWLARRRRRLAAGARMAAKRGELVIAERYPLHDFHSMETPMDGPRLQPDGPFAAVEMAQYRAIESPDLTLVLETSLETLRERKIDLPLDEHVPKVEAVAALDDRRGRLRIDVGRPYEEVLLTAKRAVWKALDEGR